MQLIMIDPRALIPNPDPLRRTKATPQADALLLATIRAVGIVEPPIILPQIGGGNGYVIQFGNRRVEQAINADLAEIPAILADPDADKDALKALVENITHAPLNPVDLWRTIERLIALTWTEEAIAVALAQTARQIRKLRLLANLLPAMLDHIATGDMPDERYLRTIAAASVDEQKEVWKKYKPSKASPRVSWHQVSHALEKKRMYAKDASFGDDLAQAYGIAWVDDLFVQGDQDGRYTTDVDAFLGAQQEWMSNHLPKRGVIVETGQWGDPKLPPKAERVHGKPGKSDHTAVYLDREGRVQNVVYRMPEVKKPKGRGGATAGSSEPAVVAKPRPDVTQKGQAMIGDLRTDALHDALSRAPIEDDILLALLVLAFAGQNVSVTSGARDASPYGSAKLEHHAVRLFDQEGKLVFDRETLQQAARLLLIDVLSCRDNRSDSGIVGRIVGDAIGADSFLANMGTEDFLSCLSRPALEASCKDTPVLPRQKVKDTRAALVQHFATGHFVHPTAAFAPATQRVTAWVAKHQAEEVDEDEDVAGTPEDLDEPDGDQSPAKAHDYPGEDDADETPGPSDEELEAYREAAE